MDVGPNISSHKTSEPENRRRMTMSSDAKVLSRHDPAAGGIRSIHTSNHERQRRAMIDAGGKASPRLASRRHSLSAASSRSSRFPISAGSASRDADRAGDLGSAGGSTSGASRSRRGSGFQLARGYSARSFHTSSSDHGCERPQSRLSITGAYVSHSLSSETEKLMRRFSLAKSGEDISAGVVGMNGGSSNLDRVRGISRSLSTRSALNHSRHNPRKDDSDPTGRLTRSLSKRSLTLRRTSVEALTPSLAGFLDKSTSQSKRRSGDCDRSVYSASDDGSNIAALADDSDEGGRSFSSSRGWGELSSNSLRGKRPEAIQYSPFPQTASFNSARGRVSTMNDELAAIEKAHCNRDFDDSDYRSLGSNDSDEGSLSNTPSLLLDDNSQQSRLLS